MTVPNDKDRIMEHLQGDWVKAWDGTRVSFTIEGQCIRNISCETCKITEEDFILAFNNENLKWQLTASIFGKDSVLINFEKKSFTLLIKNGMDIVPQIDITEWHHTNVTFKKSNAK